MARHGKRSGTDHPLHRQRAEDRRADAVTTLRRRGCAVSREDAAVLEVRFQSMLAATAEPTGS